MEIFRAAYNTAHPPGNRPRALDTSLLKQDNAMEIFRAAYNTAHTPGNRLPFTIQMSSVDRQVHKSNSTSDKGNSSLNKGSESDVDFLTNFLGVTEEQKEM